MLSFNCLPELVIHHILKYEIEDEDYLVYRLPYLAICHSWRHVALPLVYKTVFIRTSYKENVSSWSSNIDLLLSTGYSSLAQRLEIEYPNKDKLTAEELESFLNILGSRPVQWPANYQQQLVYLNEAIMQFMLGEDLVQIIEKAVGQFAQVFTRIKELRLGTSSNSSILRQIYTTLVDAFADRLHGLYLPQLNGGSLTNSLDNLTSLSIWCDIKSYPLFSKVSILPLRKLLLSGNLIDFSWRFFQKDLLSNEPVVFPNLEILFLYFKPGTRFDYTHIEGLKETVPNEHIGVKFPKLQKLDFKSHENGFVFQPELIPSHLHTVELALTGDTFIMFSKLPIKSIDFLRVVIHREFSNHSEFYAAANHFFKTIENSGDTRVSLDYIRLDDGRDINWSNIDYMYLKCADIRKLFKVLNSMPQITEVYVNGMYEYEYEPESPLCWSSGVSKLEKLSFHKVRVRDWEATLCEIVEMLKSLTNLRELETGPYLAGDIEEKIKDLSEEDYPQFKNLKLNKVPW